MNKLRYCLGCILLSVHLNAQPLWTPLDTIALMTENASMQNGQTRFVDLVNHPIKKNKWWAVSPEAGLFVSNDAALHFTLCKGSNLLPETTLSTVAVDPINDRIIYLGTGDPSKWTAGKGLWKSFNGGETFVKLTLPDCIVTAIDISPSNRLLLVVATSQGIYRSINGGVTFSLISNTNGMAITDLKRNKGNNSHVLYACGFSDFFVSQNDGATWNISNNGINFNNANHFGYGGRIAVSALDSNIVYSLFAANNGTVFLSADKGTTFATMKMNSFPNLLATHNDSLLSNSGNYALSLAIEDSINKICVAAQNVYLSVDSGKTFSQITNYKNNIPGGIHKVIYSSNDTLRIACDGGVYFSSTNGQSFSTSQFPSGYFNCSYGDIAKSIGNEIIFNTPDHGEFYYSNGTFKNIRNPMFTSDCSFSYAKHPTTYYSSTGKAFNHFTHQEKQLISGITYFNAITFSEEDTNSIFVSGANGIYHYSSTDSTANLIYASTIPIKALISIHQSLYAFNDNHEMIFWPNVYDSLSVYNTYLSPGSSTSYSAIKTSSGEIVFACGDSVFISTNNGQTWQAFNNGLPTAISWKSIVQDEYTPGLLFIAGGTNDVYYRKPNTSTWLPFKTNLPSRIAISSLKIFTSPQNDSQLYLFYKGIGILRASFDSLRNVKAICEASARNVCKGTNIQLYSKSRGAVNGQTWFFPGGTPSSSTEFNPVIHYDSTGTFDIILVANGTTNSDTLILANYLSTIADSTLPNETFDHENSFIDSIINGGETQYQWKKVSCGEMHQSVMLFENYYHNELGARDILQTKRIQLPRHRAAQLLVDIAYAPYDTNYSDTLEIQISNDCGSSYETIYCKAGEKLATTSPQQQYFMPDSLQWRTDTLQLSSYAGGENVIIRFNNVGHYGNNIYLDNIRVDTNFIQTEFDIHINVFIQGMYIGNRQMRSLLYNLGLSDDPSACDSIRIELISADRYLQQKSLLNIFGKSTITVPADFSEIPVYLKVSHRNSIPIYSKEMMIPKKLGYNLFDFTKIAHP